MPVAQRARRHRGSEFRSPSGSRVPPDFELGIPEFIPPGWSVTLTTPLLNVVLHQPDIPQNTGNIGRTCVAVGAKLWLVRPLGFQLDARHLRRAGMDYWPLLDWEVIDAWPDVVRHLPDAPVWCLTKTATRTIWEADFAPGDILLFGSETRGLPASLLEATPHRNIGLPMLPAVRSLNLASTVNTVVYEAVRQFGGLDPAPRPTVTP